MKLNTGQCPPEARGKRVIVRLNNGRVCGDQQISPVAPIGWSADGRQGCRWTLTDSPFDICEYHIVGEAPVKEGRSISGAYV